MASTWEGKTQMERSVAVDVSGQHRQRRQMLVALGILIIALVVVVWKDQDFWFPTAPQAAIDNPVEQPEPAAATPSEPRVTTPVIAPQKSKSKAHSSAVHAGHAHAAALPPVAAPQVFAAQPSGATITATNRAALPPLEIEVVAGGQRTTVRPTNRAVKVDLQSGAPGNPVPGTMEQPTSSSSAAAPAPLATNAGERVRLSPDTAQMVERPVQPNYPLLAKQMKVQGSVVLQALIGQEGSIQDLRVLSGPAILSNAAMDAVRQWRFHPYFQSGQAVETEARITVNFTISTY